MNDTQCSKTSNIDEWREAALFAGEKLALTGPIGYYRFSASEFKKWVASQPQTINAEIQFAVEDFRKRAINAITTSDIYETANMDPSAVPDFLRVGFNAVEWLAEKIRNLPMVSDKMNQIDKDTINRSVYKNKL